MKNFKVLLFFSVKFWNCLIKRYKKLIKCMSMYFCMWLWYTGVKNILFLLSYPRWNLKIEIENYKNVLFSFFEIFNKIWPKLTKRVNVHSDSLSCLYYFKVSRIWFSYMWFWVQKMVSVFRTEHSWYVHKRRWRKEEKNK